MGPELFKEENGASASLNDLPNPFRVQMWELDVYVTFRKEVFGGSTLMQK